MGNATFITFLFFSSLALTNITMHPVDCLQKIIQLLYIEPNSTTGHIKYVLNDEDFDEIDKSIQFLAKWQILKGKETWSLEGLVLILSKQVEQIDSI